jgi:DNA-binding transcriptional LysR family regulator
MDRRQLECFVAVAREQSFSRAAERLYISQPALSQHVQRLERAIGAQLILRSTRPVSLTPTGEQVYREANKILSAYRHLTSLSGGSGGAGEEVIRVGVSESLMLGAVPAVLGEYQRIQPDVSLALISRPTAELTAQFEAQQLDAMFLLADVDVRDSTSYRLYEDPYLVALPASHPLAQQFGVELAQLRNDPLILLARSSIPQHYNAIVSACTALGFSPREITVTGGFHERIGMVAAGFGVTLVPRSVAHFQVPGVAYVPLNAPKLSVPVVMYVRADAHSVVNMFGEYVLTSGISPRDPGRPGEPPS